MELFKDIDSSYWEMYHPCKDHELAAVQMKNSNKNKLNDFVLFRIWESNQGKAKNKYMCVYGHPTYPNFC